jgi:hypothetical protein
LLKADLTLADKGIRLDTNPLYWLLLLKLSADERSHGGRAFMTLPVPE